MKTTIRNIFLALTVMLALPTAAQSDLAVGDAFTQYGKMKGCKLVVLSDGKLKGYHLKVYKSLTYRLYAEEIERMLLADRKKAKKIREIVADGTLTSGYYMMKPLKEGINRYILFRKNTTGGAVIYIEGALQPDDIMKLCRK